MSDSPGIVTNPAPTNPLTIKDKEYLDRKTLSHIEALTEIARQLGHKNGTITSVVITTEIEPNTGGKLVVASNPIARMRTLLNTGNATAWFGFGSGVNSSNGIPLQPGDGYEWPLGAVDTRALYVYSLDGTQIRVLEGS